MKNKILILLITAVFIASVSFSFAVDDNATLISSDVGEDALEVADSHETLSSNNQDEISAIDNDDSVVTPALIKMGKVTKRYNGAIEYKATFYNSNGQPLKDTKVYFEVDGSDGYESTTDSSGVALLTVLIKNGNHKIAAVSADPLAVEYDNIKVFDVLTGNKNIEMYYDDGTSYNVRVFDDNGNPAKAGQKVTFAIGKKVYYKKTDKNGFAKLKIPSVPGLYKIGARYNDYVVTNNLVVKPVLKPLTSFSGKKAKKTIKYKVKILGKNNKNKRITVKFNKKTYKAKTNKKGVATFVLKTPKKVGIYKVVTSYKKTKVTSVYSKYYS